MAGLRDTRIRMSTVPPWTAERDVKTSPGKNGDVQERWFSAYRCEVVWIRVMLLDLTNFFTYGHWKPQGLNLLRGSTTTTHTLSSQWDGAHGYTVVTSGLVPRPKRSGQNRLLGQQWTRRRRNSRKLLKPLWQQQNCWTQSGTKVRHCQTAGPSCK